MIKLRDARISDILPESLESSAKQEAYARAQQKMQRLIFDYARTAIIYSQLESLPDAVLDEIAVEIRTQYYSTDLPKKIKAGLIRNTMAWHIRAGTVQAIREMVETVFGQGEVLEWYQYEGHPFCFKVVADTSYTPDTLDLFNQMLAKTKTAVSSLDVVEVMSQATGSIRFGMGIMGSVNGPVTCVPGLEDE